MGENDGDEKVGEDGEVAEEVDQREGEADVVLEAASDGKIELQAEGQPGEEREDGGGGSVSRGWRHVDLYRSWGWAMARTNAKASATTTMVSH